LFCNSLFNFFYQHPIRIKRLIHVVFFNFHAQRCKKLFHGLGLLLFRIQAFENAGNGVARVLGQLLQCFKYTIPSAASCFQLIIPEDEPVSSFDVKPSTCESFVALVSSINRMIEDLFKEHIQRILNPEIQGKPTAACAGFFVGMTITSLSVSSLTCSADKMMFGLLGKM